MLHRAILLVILVLENADVEVQRRIIRRDEQSALEHLDGGIELALLLVHVGLDAEDADPVGIVRFGLAEGLLEHLDGLRRVSGVLRIGEQEGELHARFEVLGVIRPHLAQRVDGGGGISLPGQGEAEVVVQLGEVRPFLDEQLKLGDGLGVSLLLEVDESEADPRLRRIGIPALEFLELRDRLAEAILADEQATQASAGTCTWPGICARECVRRARWHPPDGPQRS